MSKLTALHNAAKQYNPNQPRDENGRWTQAKGIAVFAIEKGIVAGAAAVGQHVGGEAGAVAAMIGARAAIVIGKKTFNAAQKQKAQEIDDTADRIEEAAMGDVFGRFVAKTVMGTIGGAIDDAVGIPGASTAAGMGVSAAVTPHLVKAARRLKGKMQEQSQTTMPGYAQ